MNTNELEVSKYVELIQARRFSLSVSQVLSQAIVEAESFGHRSVDPVHVLLSALEAPLDPKLLRSFRRVGLTEGVVRGHLEYSQNSGESTEESLKAMFHFAELLSSHKTTPRDIALGCLVSGSYDIIEIVEEELETSIKGILLSLPAPTWFVRKVENR